MFTENFDKYACVGDTIQCKAGGFDFTARIEHDADTSPSDFGGYDAEHIAAWRADAWHYCGVVISAERNGVPIERHAASLWGIELNIIENNDYLAEVANELLPEALAEAESRLQDIRRKLAQ